MPAKPRTVQIPQSRIDDTAVAMWNMEAGIDQALVCLAALTSNIVAAQSEGSLSAITLQADVFSKLPALSVALGQARAAAVDMHLGLGLVGHKLGLDTSADVSPPEHKPDVAWPWPFGAAQADAATGVVQLSRRAG